MAKYLVIVESPAKVKTIKKFLGKNYEVVASNGHVRDLPKSQMGIDVEHDYEPKYITIRGKGDILAKLRKEVKKADKVYLATDPDREGEAISWHLSKALKLDGKRCAGRISFNEITQNAVKASLKQPRDIDMNLVRCTADQTYSGPYGGLQDQPASVGKSKTWAERRTCTVGSAAHHLRPRGRDQCIYSGRILDAGCNSSKRTGEKKPLTAKFHGDENGKLAIHHAARKLDRIMDEIRGERIMKCWK